MLAFPLVPVRSVALVYLLSLALALVSSAIPWLARHLHGWPLIIPFVIGVTMGLGCAVLALPRSLWTNLVVLLVAWSGGLLLGRGVPAHFRAFLLCSSA